MEKKQKNHLSLKRKFSLLQFTFWCSWGAFTSFAGLYFRSLGLTNAQVGLALAISTLSGIPGQAFWGFLCDKKQTIRKIFILANLMIGVVILGFTFIRHTVLIMLLMAFLGFSQVPMPALLDTWVLKKQSTQKLEYGHIRLWASVGFAVFSLLFGKVVQQFGFVSLFVASSLLISITIFLAIKTEDIDQGEKNQKQLHQFSESFKEILHNRSFLFFIGICFLIGLAARTTHTLLPLLIDQVGGHSQHLGLALFVTGMFEIPMMLASKRFAKRISPRGLLLLSVILYTAQFAVLFFAKSPWMVIAAMAFQGMAFGNYLPSVRLFVNNTAPQALRTTSQALTDGLTSSLTGVIGSVAGGTVIQQYGLHVLITICIGIILLALLILAVKALLSRRADREG